MKYEKQETQTGVVSTKHGKTISIIDLFCLGDLGDLGDLGGLGGSGY